MEDLEYLGLEMCLLLLCVLVGIAVRTVAVDLGVLLAFACHACTNGGMNVKCRRFCLRPTFGGREAKAGQNAVARAQRHSL